MCNVYTKTAHTNGEGCIRNMLGISISSMMDTDLECRMKRRTTALNMMESRCKLDDPGLSPSDDFPLALPCYCSRSPSLLPIFLSLFENGPKAPACSSKS